MNIFEKLCERIGKEREAFRGEYQDKKSMEVYEDWYKISFHEAYFNMLTSNWVQDREFDREAAWLSGQGAPVGVLYGEYLRCDGEMSFDWDDMLYFIRTVARDRMREMVSLDGVIATAEGQKKKPVGKDAGRDLEGR